MSNNKPNYVKLFNNALVSVCDIIRKSFPASLIGNNYTAIHNSLHNSENNSYLLEFGSHILLNKEFKQQILDGNDSFFTDYSNELYAEKSKLSVNNILRFKDIWTKLKVSDQIKIKKYLKLLIALSSGYLDSK